MALVFRIVAIIFRFFAGSFDVELARNRGESDLPIFILAACFRSRPFRDTTLGEGEVRER